MHELTFIYFTIKIIKTSKNSPNLENFHDHSGSFNFKILRTCITHENFQCFTSFCISYVNAQILSLATIKS